MRHLSRFILLSPILIGACGEFDDTPLNQPPQIISVKAPSYVSVNDTVFARAMDPDGDSVSIAATLETATGASVPSAFLKAFTDDGLSGDHVAGDSVFTAILNRPALLAQSTSSFNLRLVPSEKGDNPGDEVIVEIPQNPDNGHPPVISNLAAPDTLQLDADTVAFRTTLDVLDADGAEDIRSVYFLSAGGSVIELFDDGTEANGDDVAGDGTYSRILILPPSTPPGTYHFVFRAVDQMNLVSNFIEHTLVVLPAPVGGL